MRALSSSNAGPRSVALDRLRHWVGVNATIIKHKNEEIGDLTVVVNPDVLNRFKKEDSGLLMELERSHSGRLTFRSDPALHRERYAIIDTATESTMAQGQG